MKTNANGIKTDIFTDMQEFYSVRFVKEDGEIWTVAKDVLIGFGFRYNTSKIRDIVSQDDIKYIRIQTKGGVQQVVFLSSNGIKDVVESLNIRDDDAKSFYKLIVNDYFKFIEQYKEDYMKNIEKDIKPSYEIEDPILRLKAYNKEIAKYQEFARLNVQLEEKVKMLEKKLLEVSDKTEIKQENFSDYVELILHRESDISIQTLAQDFDMDEEFMQKFVEDYIRENDDCFDNGLFKNTISITKIGMYKMYNELLKANYTPVVEKKY